MEATITCDASQLLVALDKIEAAIPDAGREGLRSVMGDKGVMGELVKGLPVDTGRLVNAYNQAAKQASLPGVWPRLALRPSQYTHKYRERLQNQAKLLWRSINYILNSKSAWEMQNGVRTGRLHESDQKKLDKLKAALAKTNADLERLGPTDILMKSADGRLREYSTHKGAYGGRGYLYRKGDGWYCTIENLEPHAYTVEKLSRGVAFAFARARSIGLRRMAAPAMLDVWKKVVPEVVEV